MKKPALIAVAAGVLVGAPMAWAASATYSVTTTWYEPVTQPNDSIFIGSFIYDNVNNVVTGLQGVLSESMTGGATGYPNDSMTWLPLGNQLVSWHDTELGGTFAATFKNANTSTFFGGDGWSPAAGVAVGGIYAGFPVTANNPGNAYALIFVPDNVGALAPGASLTQTWHEATSTGSLGLAYSSYADCAPGGMMGAACMTAWSSAAYGMVGTMDGYPLSQTITAAVPEAETYAMLMAGLGLVGFVARRRKHERV